MTTACTHGITSDRWIDFFANELDQQDGERLEQLLFDCPHCAAEAERWGTIVGSATLAIPPVIAPEVLRSLRSQGEPVTENVMQPGESRGAWFPEGGRLLFHRLQGLDLRAAQGVNIALRTPSGTPLARFEDVPFDREGGEVIVACQRHFGESFPANIVFEIERRRDDRVEVLAEYTVDHLDWSQR
jgi:hypothetical protein